MPKVLNCSGKKNMYIFIYKCLSLFLIVFMAKHLVSSVHCVGHSKSISCTPVYLWMVWAGRQDCKFCHESNTHNKRHPLPVYSAEKQVAYAF